MPHTSERQHVYEAVLAQAKELGPVSRQGTQGRVLWTPCYDALLGKAIDKDLAEIWDIDYTTVWWRRRVLSIEPFGSSSARLKWTRPMIAVLGTVTDGEIAKMYMISPRSVVIKRKALGIQACHQRRNCLRVTAAIRKRLGKVPDRVLATELGWDDGTIAHARRREHIAPHPQKKVNWQAPEVMTLLGTMSDRSLAARLGVSAPVVWKRRRRLRIPPHATRTLCTSRPSASSQRTTKN